MTTILFRSGTRQSAELRYTERTRLTNTEDGSEALPAPTDQAGSRSMNPNKALWEKGDFTQIAESMRESGQALVNQLGITRGLNVLDLGCGDGTTALPEARLGADVLGVDIAKNLVDAGNRRATEAGLTNCKFQEGDASNLHDLKDDTFDLVVSIFGAMFAPKPLMWPRRWCARPSLEAGSSWGIGFPMIRHWWHRF